MTNKSKLFTVVIEGPNDIGRCKITKDGVFVDVQEVFQIQVGSDDEPQLAWRGRGPRVPEVVGRALGVAWRAKEALRVAQSRLDLHLGSDDMRSASMIDGARAEVAAAQLTLAEAEAKLKIARD
jgi:hypothetical protein